MLLVILIVMGILGVIYASGSNSTSQTPEKFSDNQISNIHANTFEAQPHNSPLVTKAPIQKVQTLSKKPSQYAEFLASYIVINANKQEQDLLIEKFAPGTNNLATAKYNFALSLDSNPDYLVRTEAFVFQNLSKNMSRNNGTTLDDLEYKINDLNNKIDDLNDAIQH